jgi:hypothetical protein
MTLDHDAWAIVGGSMHGKVLLVTKGNTFLEAALRLQPNIDLYETTPAKYVNAGSYDLTIFDGFVPPAMPSGGLFFVNPPTGSYIFGKSGQDIGVNHINAGNDSAHLLQDVDLSSIHVLHASHQFTPAAWAQAVITTPETSLLIAGETNNRRVAALGFDLHDSDLPLQPSFPILIYNMVNWFMPPPVGGDGQVSPGEPVTISTWPGANSVTITAPGQKAVAVAPPFPAKAFAQTDATGIYFVAQRVQGQERDGAFAVNLFDPSQSRLAPANALPIAHSTDFTSGGKAIPRVLREIWPWIAAFFLLVLCAEWWLFSRGYARKSAVSGTGQGMAFLQRRNGQLQSTKHTGMFGGVQDAMEARYKHTRRRVVKTVKRVRRSGIRLR